MVLAHVVDSWTRETDRHGAPFFTLFFIGGIASPLFLFLAGVASALSAAAKARRGGALRAGAAAVQRRGWEVFALGLLFRLQAQLLGLGPLVNVFKVDMLNTMGLSMVAVSWAWRLAPSRRSRLSVLALATTATSVLTPLVRAAPWLAVLPDPFEAYLRPAGSLAAFPLFPWAGFLFAGALVGDLIDSVRERPRRDRALQAGLAVVASLGAWLGWKASFQPALFPTASFWHDSPTFFLIRLGLAALLVPLSWLVARWLGARLLQPLLTLGRSSLFVYWIHVEMVYGVLAEPLKKDLPLWGSLVGTALMTVWLFALVLVKNRAVERIELRGPLRILAPVLR